MQAKNSQIPDDALTDRFRLAWKETGRALWFIQQTEETLVLYLSLILHPKGKREACLAMLEKHFKKTLGALLSELRKSVEVPADFDSRLSKFNDERNWLAHRIGRENYADLYDRKKFEALFRRLDDLKEEAKAITDMFSRLCDKWLIVNGYCTKEELASQTERLFNQYRGGMT